MAGGREEVQGKRGGGEVGWRGAGERRRKKRTCFREASRQFAYFNEFIIFFKRTSISYDLFIFLSRPLLLCCSLVHVHIFFWRSRVLGLRAPRRGATLLFYFSIRLTFILCIFLLFSCARLDDPNLSFIFISLYMKL